MHPRNPYHTSPDFEELAESYPPLKSHLISTATGVSIDFHDAKAQRCLTQALLHRDFGLEVSIPDDRLCPPVPNRLNYILWLQDIMLATRAGISEDQSTITGVDIGTGASAIYPLLGCATSSNWRFIATDIDTHSLQHARTNIAQNNLDDRIHVVQVSADGPIFAPSIFDISCHIDFTMCNPPFYGDREEVLRSAETKELGPNAVCTGTDTEMITPGGEVMFVRRMVEESLILKTQCRWYSSMLGKMSSLIDVVELLRTKQVENYAVTEFIQGKTRRWAIAWSFTDERLPDSFARISNPALHSIVPPRNTLKQSFSAVSSTNQLLDAVRLVLPVIDGVTFDTVVPRDEARTGISRQLMVHASSNTWSRAARRKKLLGTPVHPTENIPPALICLITAVHITQTAGEQGALEFQWIRGESRGLFESFMAHVSRKVEAALKSSGDGIVS